jgi:DNA mismatch endonuclease, patch repair protein
MSANKARNTGPERRLRTELLKIGARGFRLNSATTPGRPDLLFPSRRVAVFVHGCFWHRCPHCNPPMPKSHVEFWERKFSANRRRDARKARILRREGWAVLTVWECQLRNDSHRAAMRVLARLERH